MKKFIGFIVLVLATCFQLRSQHTEGNPFARLGYNADVYTFGEENEFHDREEVVEIDDVLFNTRTNEVVGFVKEDADTLIELKPELQSMSIDPHCEKYYSITPYAYCLNNPVRFIDPDGRDVFITDSLNNEALQQLQATAGTGVTLTLGDDGRLCYILNSEQKLSKNAQTIIGIIDDSSITVNMKATGGLYTSTGNLYIGGAFMGNSISRDQDGNPIAFGYQEVNPNVLGAIDMTIGDSGGMILHELTESYEGAKMSRAIGMPSGISNQPNSIYNAAHGSATPQKVRVKQVWYDKNGNTTNNIQSVAKVNWIVTDRNGNSRIIQTLQ